MNPKSKKSVVRRYLSNVRCFFSSSDVRCQMSAVSPVSCQLSVVSCFPFVRCQMSAVSPVRCQLSVVSCYSRGFAALPVILALTALIMAAGIGIAMTSFTESMISLGSAQSSQALFYAEAGAQDALMRIARKKNYTCDSPSTGCYTIAYVNNGCSGNYGCARITVSSATSPKVIVSEGRVKDNIRKMQVDVSFDSNLNGEIATTTWAEVMN